MYHKQCQNADYVFKNGKVITVNPEDEIVTAAVVFENKIIYVGDDKRAEDYISADTKVFDLDGKTMTPGFIDSHIHAALTGARKSIFVDIDPKKAPNKPELLKIIKLAVSKAKPGEWVMFWGYDEQRMEEGQHPTVEELDKIAPNNPLLVSRCCGHMGAFNTAALKIGNINPETAKNFVEGQVEIVNGKLTGLLYETAYYNMWNHVDFKEEDILNALQIESDDLVKVGVTSVHDAGSYGSVVYSAYLKAVERGVFKPRVAQMFFSLFGKDSVIRDIRRFIDTGVGPIGNDRIRYGIMKIMIDGGASIPNCAVRIPYCHDGNMGIMSMDSEEIDEIAYEIHKAGLQATAHCIGDRAVEAWVNAIEKAQEKFPREDSRHRIEHCGIVDWDLVEKIKALKMIPTPNTRFIYLNGDRYLKFFGERVDMMFPCRTWIDEGIIAAIGTDCPLFPENPLLGLSSAVSRKSETGNDIGSCQNISILEAIRLYTYNGAYASFEEDKKGSIEVGKLADIAVFDGDLVEATPQELESIKCVLTMIDGEIVYQDKNF